MRISMCLIVAALLHGLAGSANAQFLAGMSVGDNDSHVTLTIKADGTCALTNETVQPRKPLEMQITMWERYSQVQDTIDDEHPAAMPPPSKPKSFTDEELTAKVREMYEQQRSYGPIEALTVQKVDLSSNSVRLVTGRMFGSLKELLSETPYTWGPHFLMFENARLEIDTNRNLRLTFSSSERGGRFDRSIARSWKSSKMKGEWKLVLPGKILSSGLPLTQDNTTGIAVDGEKPESVDAVLQLVGKPLVITAEPAGLKIDEPLDSKMLVRAAWAQRKTQPDLPITDAGPGFAAESVSLTLSTVHYFPEGEKLLKNRPEAYLWGMGTTGTVVSAKLFPPKGREIRSVSAIRVTSAKDDKGRAVTCASTNEDEESGYTEVQSFGGSDESGKGATQIELRLGLPAGDAKSIDELQAEAVALTIGSWKEMVLTNVQADTNRLIDLGEVLPGATLKVKKIGSGANKRVEATLEGPPGVNQLDLRIKFNTRQSQSHMMEQQSKTAGGKVTRQVMVQGFESDMIGQEPKKNPITLLVRYPQDVKRERVRFKLSALDLL